MSSQRTASAATRYIAAGWAAFTGTHLLLSHPPVRQELIHRLGDEDKYRGLYSLVSVATFGPTTFLYIRYARGRGAIPVWTELTKNNTLVRGVGIGVKGMAAVGFGQSVATPSPIAASPDGGQSKVDVRGINRITRHGMFTSLALLGLGNILLRGYTGDLVYWAGYPLIWLLGCPHQDSRVRATLPKEFFDQTSFLPFQAILEGRNSLKDAVSEFNKPVLVASIVAPLMFL